MWLRHALKLTGRCEDSMVEKQLQYAVARAFTVLQSLFNAMGEHATTLSSPRVAACLALALHLHDT